MTVLQRGGELMAVFYYQSPQARLKRAERLCDVAEKLVGEIAPNGARFGEWQVYLTTSRHISTSRVLEFPRTER